MNGYFSVEIDENRNFVSFETDCTEINTIGIHFFQKNAWVEGASFRNDIQHVLVGARGFVRFSSESFELFKLESEDAKRMHYLKATIADANSSTFRSFLQQISDSSAYMRVPLAFLSKDAHICYANELFNALTDSDSIEEMLTSEILLNYEILFSQLFKAWDTGFSTIAQIANGRLSGNLLISPCWLDSETFAGFRLEFQPQKLVKAIALSDSLSNLPLNNPNPVFKFSSEGVLLFANDAAKQILGNRYGIIDASLLQTVYEIVVESRKKDELKLHFQLAERWFLMRFIHTVTESLIYLSDITEEHLVKEEFEQTFSQLTAIINSSRSSIVLLSIHRKILFFNQRARKEIRKYFGFELEEGVDLPELDASISRTIDIAIQTAIDGKHQLSYELDFEYLPGKKIWFNFMVYPITNQIDEVSGVCLSIQNITRAKVAEQETERVKSFYETILNNLPSDIAVFDPEHHYLFLNPHAIRDPELRRWMIGKTDYDFVARRNLEHSIADQRRAMFNQVVQTKEIYTFVDEHKRNGESIYVLRKFFPVVEHDEVKLVIGYGLDITSEKQAEKRITASENRFKGLFENNPMLLFIVDEHFVIQDLNITAKIAFKLENNAIEGSDFRNFISSENCDAFAAKFGDAFQLEVNQTYQFNCVLQSSGIELSVEFTTTPVVDETGKKMLLLAGIDQAERLKSDDKLRNSEEFNRLLVKEMPIPFAIVDWDKAVYLNDACRRLIEADEHTDFSSQSLFTFVDPAYHALFAERLQKRYAGEGSPPTLIKINTIKGATRYVEMQGGLLNREGTLLNFVTFTDRTEETLIEQARKQAAEALIESEQKLSLLVASLPVVPYSAFFEEKYTFNYLNERIFQLIGFTAEEVLEQPGFWLSRIHKDDLMLLSKASQNFNTSGEASLEYRIRNAFEIDVWIRETVRRIIDPAGKTIGVTGVFQDISNEKSQSERRRLIESTLFEISKEELSATESLYAFYKAVFNRLKLNLGISGISIWKAEQEVYRTIESFHVRDETAFERTEQTINKQQIDALLRAVNTISTDSRDNALDETINLNVIFGIPHKTSLLLSLVRSSSGDNLLMLIEHEDANFTWEYEHFNLITSLSELISFNLEYFQRIESDNKLREAYRLAKIGAWEIEPEKNRVYWSEAMFEFYGMDSKTSHALTFDDALQFIHPDDKELFEQSFKNLQQHKQAYKIECRHVLHGNKVRYYEKSALAIPSSSGHTLFMGVTIDITDKKLIENELQLRQRGRLISNAVGSSVSPATSLNEMFELFAEAFVQTAPVRHISVYSDEVNFGIYSTFYSYPTNSHIDLDFVATLNKEIALGLSSAPLNTVRPLHASLPDCLVSPVQMPGRGKFYLIILLNNPSELNDDFISITEMVIQLLHEKAERIFAEIKLRDLNLELIDTNLQLRQYSYIVSHNLRAPVANVLGCLNLINEEEPSDSRNKILMDGLKISANAVDSILRDLNKILNIKEDVVKHFEFIGFNALLNEVMENLKNEMAGIEYTLTRDFEEVTGMMAFKPYLLSIFQNLISNSFRYRRTDKKLELTVAAKSQGHKIELHFIDNGRGIDLQKNRKRLFKLYERFHADVAGTGLGLNMVQEQARVLGGSIQIESEVDAGTKFILTFVPKV
jgi:PAS domain S-box-containing protein